MSDPNDAFKINPGEVLGWPSLRIKYPTDPAKLAELLPPGLEPSDTSNVHLNIYLIPVPDEPEFGVVIDVDADYKGQKGRYCLGYGIGTVHIQEEHVDGPHVAHGRAANLEAYRYRGR